MGVTVVFDYDAWIARYPEFTQVDEPTAQAYFNEATLFHANDGSGPVLDQTVQQTLMNMMTAHIAAINSPDQFGNSPSPLVGKLQSVGQGSVNASVLYNPTNPEQWYAQTKYGAAYWAATAIYRTFRPMRGWARRRFGMFPVRY